MVNNTKLMYLYSRKTQKEHTITIRSSSYVGLYHSLQRINLALVSICNFDI